jgi:hypothetical protein
MKWMLSNNDSRLQVLAMHTVSCSDLVKDDSFLYVIVFGRSGSRYIPDVDSSPSKMMMSFKFASMNQMKSTFS